MRKKLKERLKGSLKIRIFYKKDFILSDEKRLNT
ncbi:UNVERIFIED_ORG: hypothetical protein J2X74_005665 [Bacillus sp. 1751]|nr:hypothetical protein [Bacillus sp. 1751]